MIYNLLMIWINILSVMSMLQYTHVTIASDGDVHFSRIKSIM